MCRWFGSQCDGDSTDGARGCIEVETLGKEGRDGTGSDSRCCGEDVDLLVVPVEGIGGLWISEGGWEGLVGDEEVNLVQIDGIVLRSVDCDSVGGELGGLCDAMEVGPCVGSGLCVCRRVDYSEGSVHRSRYSNGEGGGMTWESHGWPNVQRRDHSWKPSVGEGHSSRSTDHGGGTVGPRDAIVSYRRTRYDIIQGSDCRC